jgi:tetratricopeptide (TPR) repeat protein
MHLHRTLWTVAAALIVLMGCGSSERGLEYVGSAACGECHGAAMQLVAGTAHPLAMQVATEASVLGDFDDARFTHFGVTSDFYRRDGGWRVRTDGPDGEPTEYEVTHTLGVYPLQQYMARFPDGRYQVLPIAWDTRPATVGGQRWFHLHPDEAIPHTDELHWTGPLQNWNYMCAECHVTGFQRGYDLTADGYATTWYEAGVGCEGCHGPGSGHVEWAGAWERDTAAARAAWGDGAGLLVDLGTKRGGWAFEAGHPIARRTEPLGWNAQTETCGVCHARRETLVSEYLPGGSLLATHRPALLEEGLYYADGQMLDEVYEYGSFLQSLMHRAGVTCSDCHHPSTQEVAPGNVACAKCHQPDTYDTAAHTFHEDGTPGASCVACHMPPRTYMVIDPRHDHAIRSPRPDLSLRIGTPNACTTCHTDRSDAWAARIVEQRYGAPDPVRHYGDVIDAGRRGVPAADSALIRLASDTAEGGIVRATAVSLLDRYASPAAARAVAAAARDPEPLVRLAAAMTGELLTLDARLPALAHLLEDSLLAIRVEAARVLAEITGDRMTTEQRARAAAAFAEFVAAQLVNAERPESHLRLGVLYTRRGRIDLAEHHYREAIRVGPRYAGGYANLTDLYRALGRDAEGERVLRDGLRSVHQPAVLHHSLGLLLVRTRRLDEAIVELAEAARLDPDVPRFAHVHAVALHTVGRSAEAIGVLDQALLRAPYDRELKETLTAIRATSTEP